MPFNIEDIWVYRIIPIQNLTSVLNEGLFCKNAGRKTRDFLSIGSPDVIARRDKVIVKCYNDTVVNDYIPFHFSVRTPMLYNIITGHGVTKVPQEDIVYLCCRLVELTTKNFKWCYTDGNAAAAISKFFNNLEGIEAYVDWHSIETTDFRDDNSDGDEDRIRKKLAEFLVKEYVPVEYIRKIVVFTTSMHKEVNAIVNRLKLDIEVLINPNGKFYFL